MIDQILWTLDMIFTLIVKIGLIGVIYKYLTGGQK